MGCFVRTALALSVLSLSFSVAQAQVEPTVGLDSDMPARVRPLWRESNIVRSFTLMNITTGRPVRGFNPIRHGAEVDLANIPGGKVTVRANLMKSRALSVRRVEFTVSGNQKKRVNFFAPYSISGDAKGKYREWKVTPRFLSCLSGSSQEHTPERTGISCSSGPICRSE